MSEASNPKRGTTTRNIAYIFLIIFLIVAIIAIIAGAGLSSMHFTHPSVIFPLNAGGILGQVVSEQLQQLFSFVGATLLSLTFFLFFNMKLKGHFRLSKDILNCF